MQKQDEFNWDRLSGFSYSGINLVDEINQLNPKKVLDIGCGQNLLKGLVHNLYGFDKEYYPSIDEHATIQTIKIDPESIDVALCLGSLTYIPRESQLEQLEKIVSWVKPEGYIVVRTHPFIDYQGHQEEYFAQIGTSRRFYYSDFYDWTEKLNLTLHKPIRLDINSNFPQIERLVWWWKKLN